MELFSDITKLARKFHEIVFPYGNITKQLLQSSATETGIHADKVLKQVARTINSLKNPTIFAIVRKSPDSEHELIVRIKVSTIGLSNHEKVRYGETLADLVGHHEGKLKHLSYNDKGFCYNIRYIGSDSSENCTRCAKVIVHIREASKRITNVVEEIKYMSASRKLMAYYPRQISSYS